MAVKDYFEELNEDDQQEVLAVVETVIEKVSFENEDTHEKIIDVNKLSALIEKLTAEKKSAKEAADEREKSEKASQLALSKIKGVEASKKIEVGDIITFKMSGKEFSLPVLKKSEKTYTVEIPAEFLPEDSKSNKRYIKFEKVESFKKAEKVAA